MQFRVVTLNLEQDHKRWSDRHPLISAEIAGLRPDVIAFNDVRVPLQTARLLRDSAITRTGIPYKLVQQTRAEDLISWVDDTDIDGFNLSRIVTPEGLEDFVDLVVPILQERGVYKTAYREGTLRQKLFGRSARLPEAHIGASYRHRRAVDAGAGRAPLPESVT